MRRLATGGSDRWRPEALLASGAEGQAGGHAPCEDKVGSLMDGSKGDVLVFLLQGASDRTKLHSVKPLQRLNKEVQRPAGVVGISPSKALSSA